MVSSASCFHRVRSRSISLFCCWPGFALLSRSRQASQPAMRGPGTCSTLLSSRSPSLQSSRSPSPSCGPASRRCSQSELSQDGGLLIPCRSGSPYSRPRQCGPRIVPSPCPCPPPVSRASVLTLRALRTRWDMLPSANWNRVGEWPGRSSPSTPFTPDTAAAVYLSASSLAILVLPPPYVRYMHLHLSPVASARRLCRRL